MPKAIQDPIHGSIKVEDWCMELIDTPQLQRLRRINQIGFANLVYPGANHTRFEHSIGVMHIAARLADKMTCDERSKMEVVAAALLHDIGHAPFSHSSEIIVKKYLRMEHEDVLPLIKGTELEDVLNDAGLRPRKIAELVKGPSIVSGDIDADRMDYLVRDSYYTGVAYGVFDLMRLVDKIYFDGETPIIDGSALRAAESLLISRFMMYPTVYYHHVCRIARKMYEKAVEYCIEEGELEAKLLLKMDDYDMVAFLRSRNGYAGEVMELIDSRRLFKRAIYVNRSRVGIEKINARRAEVEIAAEVGIDEKYVIVDAPQVEEAKELKAVVDVDGQRMKLEDVSPLVRALKEAEKDILKLGVYTKKEFVEEVARVAVKYFNIERIPKQKKLDEVLPIW
ncbi:HD domain-containing protein [Archaeoglobus veneficus]|uniref:Metal dependent phosphohydrolase n=1 Tax=Archaeoglobus veneficus (strain DSM 11195 / SNP6) TaxID=693661 RepID=F2KRD5_ARCVS|nr:HD domain-containing protein [Archaeoglobus veneficus]AEA47869.1 metal dependent phosphohydrolase [Archaeoglobus veneficus SNP6]